MKLNFTIDANIISRFQYSRIYGQSCAAIRCVEYVSSIHIIVMDDAGFIENEWISTAAGTNSLSLKDWIADLLASDTIRLVTVRKDAQFSKFMKSLGIPKKDQKYFDVMRCAAGGIIISEDIDLFDPTEKSATSERKERIKEDPNCRCNRAMRPYGIFVRRPTQALNEE